MRGLSLRLASAGVVVAASAATFIGPSAASAACSGAKIKGQGSSLQALAQNTVWRPGFNAKCGSEQVEEYLASGSGAGIKQWGVGKLEHKFGPANAYSGTDQPPNATQKAEIELFTGGGKLLEIPTLQAAITISMHLPAGCTSAESGTSTKESKRKKKLALNEQTIQKIFSRQITKWSEIKEFGDKLLPAGCAGETEITRAVREDGSGTTATFDKFLFENNKAPVDGTKTWNELAEEASNTKWPEEGVKLVRGKGNGGVAKKVGEVAGSIGYVNLADARASTLFTPEGAGGEGTALFWALVQNNPKSEKKYIDPSDDGEVNALSNSNCADTKYVDLNGEGKKAKFPPESTEDVWNEVTAELKEKNYPICGFTYDLSLTKFSGTESEGAPATEAEVETLQQYFGYMLGEGQTALLGHDYLGLPNVGTAKKNVLDIAQAGQAKIKF